MNKNDPKVEHVLRVTYAGFNCSCERWRIGSWFGAHEAFAKHFERETEATS